MQELHKSFFVIARRNRLQKRNRNFSGSYDKTAAGPEEAAVQRNRNADGSGLTIKKRHARLIVRHIADGLARALRENDELAALRNCRARLARKIGQGLRARNERRRKGLSVVLERYERMYLPRGPSEGPVTLDTLHMLTSFETFDVLAIPGRSFEDVVAIIQKMADGAIGFTPKFVPAHRR